MKSRLVHTVAALGLWAGLFAAGSGSAGVLTLEFPVAAAVSHDQSSALGSFDLPIGPAKGGVVPTSALEGSVAVTAWHLQAKGMTTLEILAPLREQLAAAGYAVLFECETFACGGFDFRFGASILAEPAMHVDLGDFRFVSARRSTAEGPEHLALVISRSSTLGFVQLTRIAPASAAPAVTTTAAPQPEAPPTGDTQPEAAPAETTGLSPLEQGFASRGSVALDDLVFDSGSADLAAGSYASLDTLAAYLLANPQSRVALVGHTDASGGLDGNIALSRQRAASVRSRLLNDYNIPLDQVVAEGVGYLAPRDSNLTETGLTRNRRVEVMLLVGP